MPPRDEIEDGSLTAAQQALVSIVEDTVGDALRDVWVLDQRSQQPLYLRADVARNIEEVDVERYMDNERFGFVTRETYNQLHYSDFGYTLRGFDSWELFRTFLTIDGEEVGVLCSVDRTEGGFDYSQLNDEIHALLEEYEVSAFAPAED